MLSIVLMTGCSMTEQQPGNNDTIADVNKTVPDTTSSVLATVNGEDITSEDVTETKQSLSQKGQQISEEQALEQTINQRLLSQKVKEENVTVSTEEAESTIRAQLAQQNMTLENYKSQLEMQGISYKEELESLKNRMATQKYLKKRRPPMSYSLQASSYSSSQSLPRS